MASRGKYILKMSLQKAETDRIKEVTKSNETNLNVVYDRTSSSPPEKPMKNMAEKRVGEIDQNNNTKFGFMHNKTSKSDFELYRIQGVSVTNIEDTLRCDENDIGSKDVNLNETNDVSLQSCETDNTDMSESDVSSKFYDSDDSVRDPDWKLETYRKRKRSTPSSDYESDDSIPDKPKTKANYKKTRTTEVTTCQNRTSDAKTQKNIRRTTDQVFESEQLVADIRNVNPEMHNTVRMAADQDIDNETLTAVRVINADAHTMKQSVMPLGIGIVATGQENNDANLDENIVLQTDHGEIEVVREEEVTTATCDGKKKRPRSKKGMGKPDTWQNIINKKLRMEGQPYTGIKTIDGKKSYCVNKQDRLQGDRDCGRRCQKVRQCYDISDTLRKDIFDAFWYRMDWNEKKIFVVSLVSRTEPSSQRNDSKRKFTYTYHFRNGEQKVRVCKEFFLSTLGISEHTVYQWMNKADENGLPHPKVEANKSPKRESAEWKNAREFLESLPKMPSHYCRSTSSKIYLEPVFASFADLLRVYEEHCLKHGYKAVGRKLLSRIFDQMNLALFRPKKDQCDVCVGYETQNVSEEDYNLHIQRKKDARAEKDNAKQRALQSDKVQVFTMDVQSVLLCPRIEASAIYFKMKLASHNFTVYDMANGNVKCYFWHEGEGGLTANSFASCVNDHIESVLKADTEEIVIFSDGCGYQNRNATLSNTLLRLAVKHKIIVTQNFLEKGHTQMEVDSVHSTIERRLQKRPIYAPSNYVELIQSVRAHHPYDVKYLDHKFFKDFSALKYYETIRPGNKAGDPVVADIRSLKYKPDGEIQYKLSFSDEYIELPKRRNSKFPNGEEAIPSLYQRPLEIKGTKFEHLQQLKAVIPKDYHPFYDTLRHTS